MKFATEPQSHRATEPQSHRATEPQSHREHREHRVLNRPLRTESMRGPALPKPSVSQCLSVSVSSVSSVVHLPCLSVVHSLFLAVSAIPRCFSCDILPCTLIRFHED